jgi:hypothetical protein
MPPKTDLPLTYSDDLIVLDQYTAKDVENHLAGNRCRRRQRSRSDPVRFRSP